MGWVGTVSSQMDSERLPVAPLYANVPAYCSHVKMYCKRARLLFSNPRLSSFLNTDQPEFSQPPQNQVVNEGLNVVFTCDANGNPPPTFSWTIDGSAVNTTANPRISLTGDSKQLTITSVNRTDSGEYRCVASNIVETVNSTAASLTVQCKKMFSHLDQLCKKGRKKNNPKVCSPQIGTFILRPRSDAQLYGPNLIRII